MVKIAFYKSEYGKLDDKIIDVFTGNIGYSHVAFIVNDHTILESYQSKGVTLTYTDIHDGRWEIIELPKEDFYNVYEKLKKQLGKKYDWIGLIINWVIPIQRLFRHDLDPFRKWWCSELVAYGLGITPDNISPNNLYNQLTRQ